MKQNGTNLQFQESAEATLKNGKDHSHTMIVFDIDKFHDIIEYYGYDTANEVLAQIELILKAYIQQPSLYCRLCNDNFVILLQDYKDIDVAMLAIQLTEELSGYYADTKLSFGISKADTGADISSLYRRAYYAKNTVKGRGRHLLANFNEIIQTGQQTSLAVI